MFRLLSTGILLLSLSSCGGSNRPPVGENQEDNGSLDPPTDLFYATLEGRYLVEVDIPENVPSVQGEVSSWSITPTLPSGLQLDAETGVIGGRPLETLAQTGYQVVASGPDGETAALIHISVDDAPRFVYSTGPSENRLSEYVVDPFGGGLSFAGAHSHQAAQPGPEELVVHPSGTLAFTPNRGVLGKPSSISTYSLDAESGRLVHSSEFPCGEGPRSLVLAQDGERAYAITHEENILYSFAVDPDSGVLTLLSERLTNTGPTGMALDPLERFLYVIHDHSADIAVFHLDATTRAAGPKVTGMNYWGFVPTDIEIAQGGERAYISFEGPDALITYDIDPETGGLLTLTQVVTAGIPRDIELSVYSDFLYVVLEDLDRVSVYSLHAEEGWPAHVADFAVGDAPCHMALDESGRFAYVLNADSQDITALTVDLVSGDLAQCGSIRACRGATRVTVSSGDRPAQPGVDNLWVLNSGSSSLSGFRVDSHTGMPVSTGAASATGAGPEAVEVDPWGRFVFVANGDDQDIAVYQLNPTTGTLVENLSRTPTSSAPSAFAVDPTGEFLYVTLSAEDTVVSYSVHPSTGALALEQSTPTGSGPSAVSVDPTGQFMYVANTGAGAHSLSCYDIVDGRVLSGPVDVAAPGAPGPPRFSPTGDRLYVALQTADVVLPFAIHPQTGVIASIPSGLASTSRFPRVAAVHPAGALAFVAVEGSAGEEGHVAAFEVGDGGGLTPLGQTVAGSTPSDLLLSPAGDYMFVVNRGSEDLSVMRIHPETGGASAVHQIPVGSEPKALAFSRSWN